MSYYLEEEMIKSGGMVEKKIIKRKGTSENG